MRSARSAPAMRISALPTPGRWCLRAPMTISRSRLVAVVYARPPQAIFCGEDAGLKTPKGSRRQVDRQSGRRLDPRHVPGVRQGGRHRCRQGELGRGGSSALPGLLATGKVPCVGQFTVGEPLLRAQAAPKKLVRFAYSDPGLSYYGNGIIATETTIKSNPDLVKRFVAATIRGLKAAFADPAEAGAIMHKYHPEVSSGGRQGRDRSRGRTGPGQRPTARRDRSGAEFRRPSTSSTVRSSSSPR